MPGTSSQAGGAGRQKSGATIVHLPAPPHTRPGTGPHPHKAITGKRSQICHECVTTRKQKGLGGGSKMHTRVQRRDKYRAFGTGVWRNTSHGGAAHGRTGTSFGFFGQILDVMSSTDEKAQRRDGGTWSSVCAQPCGRCSQCPSEAPPPPRPQHVTTAAPSSTHLPAASAACVCVCVGPAGVSRVRTLARVCVCVCARVRGSLSLPDARLGGKAREREREAARRREQREEGKDS